MGIQDLWPRAPHSDQHAVPVIHTFARHCVMPSCIKGARGEPFAFKAASEICIALECILWSTALQGHMISLTYHTWIHDLMSASC